MVFDSENFCDALPQGTRRLVYDLEKDPFQLNPILDGQGQDALLDELQEDLGKRLQDIGDDFVSRYWLTPRHL